MSVAGDGFLGLGLPSAHGGHQDANRTDYSTISQLKTHGLIDKLQFAVYSARSDSNLMAENGNLTSPKNKKDKSHPSQIRFGGWNADLVDEESDLLYWFNTAEKDSWKLHLNSVHVGDGRSDILEAATALALINPAVPFISAPAAYFDRIKQHLVTRNFNHKLRCDSQDWCYFENACSEIVEGLQSLSF